MFLYLRVVLSCSAKLKIMKFDLKCKQRHPTDKADILSYESNVWLECLHYFYYY